MYEDGRFRTVWDGRLEFAEVLRCLGTVHCPGIWLEEFLGSAEPVLARGTADEVHTRPLHLSA